MPSINIAVTGCGHGELDAFYRVCDVFEQNGKKIDLLIITGDFQAMRNQEDLGCMKCPAKYQHMVVFHQNNLLIDEFSQILFRKKGSTYSDDLYRRKP